MLYEVITVIGEELHGKGKIIYSVDDILLEGFGKMANFLWPMPFFLMTNQTIFLVGFKP